MSFTKEDFRRLGLFVVAFDLEKMAHADFSGMDLGDSLVTISGRNISRAGHEDTSTAKKAYIRVQYDGILDISQFGAIVHQ